MATKTTWSRPSTVCSAIACALVIVSAFVLLTSCTGVHVVRAPFVSPVVVPAPEQFKMNVVVKNGTNTTQSGWVFYVYAEYGTPTPFSNSFEKHFVLPTLAPDQTWALTDFDVKNTNVPCLKDQCQGHLWLVLCQYLAPTWNKCTAPKDVYSNLETCVHVQWQPSGGLAEMSVGKCPA